MPGCLWSLGEVERLVTCPRYCVQGAKTYPSRRTALAPAKATCPEVKCKDEETKEIEVGGTKTCTEPPPPCQTSCDTGCKGKVYDDWLPKAADQCKNKKPFTPVTGLDT